MKNGEYDDLEIIRLKSATLNIGYLYQMTRIEKECELASYEAEELMEHIERYDTYACLLDSVLVGFITLNPKSRSLGGSLHIVNVNVARKHQRKGIATQLILQSCRNYAETHAGKSVTVGLELPNDPAVALYKSLGFEECTDLVAMRLYTSFTIDQFGDFQPVCDDGIIGMVTPLQALLERLGEQEKR